MLVACDGLYAWSLGSWDGINGGVECFILFRPGQRVSKELITEMTMNRLPLPVVSRSRYRGMRSEMSKHEGER